MNKSRRKILLTIGATLASLPFNKLLQAAEILNLDAKSVENFHYIYGDKVYKKEFYNFLVNVFHLYPEDKMHQLIANMTHQETSDKNIYIKAQNKLSDIKPLLADFTYSIPALSKQKKVIAAQTSSLLKGQKNFTGYLEIGSNGRYLDTLEEAFKIDGDIFFLSELESSYSPVDMVDRGQIFKAGKDLKLNNYASNLGKHIPKKSLDLVTVYIGLHHCPLNLREEFITSIRDAMSDDGVLILRDHDAHNEKMQRVVALAHDVFNMGTQESWSYNEAELRLFYSLSYLDKMLNKFGFKSDGEKLYQKGDPTLNALMLYKKS